MFNPYYARPIGTEKFEKHLLSLMVEGIETEKTAREALPEIKVVPRVMPGERKRGDPVDDCWRDLNTAVLTLAIIDYLRAYRYKLKYEDSTHPQALVWFSRCVEMENGYFRKDGDREQLFDAILDKIHAANYLQEKLAIIDRIQDRLLYVGWSGRGRS